VRVDHGIKQGLAISPFYDPMIAKVIAQGATREEARARLIRALKESIILGPTTNRHFLISLLEHPEFAAGKATTAFIGKHAFPAPTVSDRHWQLAASLLWRRSAERYPAALRGWRNSNPEPTPLVLAVGESQRTLQLAPADVSSETPPFCIDGNDVIVDLGAHAVRFQDRTYLPPASAAEGSDGKLRAPMDGRIVAINVEAGDKVARGQTLVVLEAMKIQHQLKAAADAEVESVAVREGQQVSNRTVLVTMGTKDVA
jgi:geranyl-CoA carboxylase alpha subunit